MNVEQLSVNNKGASRDTYYARFYGRVDLTPNLVHLTKPSKSYLDLFNFQKLKANDF